LTLEIGLILAIFAVAIALFASERLPMDVVALSVLAVLVVLQLVTPQEAISGLSNAATVTVASMFVLSAGLQRTGALLALGRALVRLGERKLTFLLLMMPGAGVSSAFINNTPVVAVMLPIVLGVAARHKVSASQWLIPLSFSSQFGGVCTLIGTSTDLPVNAAARDAGYGGFSMFEFSKLGVVLFAAGTVYFLLVGRFLLPERRSQALSEIYKLDDFVTELRVVKDSPPIGTKLSKASWFNEHGVRMLKLFRKERALRTWRTNPLRQGDVLLVECEVGLLIDAKEARKLELNPEFRLRDNMLKDTDRVLVEALVAPRSRLAGSTLSELYFKRSYRVIVLALRRRGQSLRDRLDRVRLKVGNAFLLEGPPHEIDRLPNDEDFIILGEQNDVRFFRGKAPLAVAVVAAVVLAGSFTATPIVAAAVVGAVVMVLTGCLRIQDAYDAIDWRVIFLLAGTLPFGVAMDNTGTAQWIAQHAIGLVGHFGLVAVLAALCPVTALLTETMSNNATAVLLTPIASSSALQLEVDPTPFLLAIPFAASTAFAAPVGYQTNTMVYNPGAMSTPIS
jgi:di/tricarboxylate transporter